MYRVSQQNDARPENPSQIDLRALNSAKMEATKKNNFSRQTPHSLLEIASRTMCRLVIEEVNTEQYPPHGALELGDEGQLRF